jgi:hypothetical protein
MVFGGASWYSEVPQEDSITKKRIIKYRNSLHAGQDFLNQLFNIKLNIKITCEEIYKTTFRIKNFRCRAC